MQRTLPVLVTVGIVLAAPGVEAQVSPDSLEAVSNAPAIVDTLRPIAHPFSDRPYSFGAPLDSVLPARAFDFDLTTSMADVAGAFAYALGNLGWPHQWSYMALPPSSVELTIDGVALRDPATHRVLFDAVPVDVAQPVLGSLAAPGAAVHLETAIRPLDQRRPYTELRYQVGARGLQLFSGMHVQQRQWQILGAPTVTQFVARFGFHEWTGGYPNSESNLSQAFGRIGFTSRRWRIRFTNSYTLRTRGAHSGVVPRPGQGFDSVYDRSGARVNDQTAEQRLQRNQLDVSVEHTWETDLKPLVVSSSYVRSLYRYTNEMEAETSSSEIHLRVEQAAPEFLAGHETSGRVTLVTENLSSDRLIEGGGGSTKSRFEVSVLDRFDIGNLAARANLGIHAVNRWIYPSAGFTLGGTFDGFSIDAEAGVNARAPSPLEVSGGLGIVSPTEAFTDAASQSLRLSLRVPGKIIGFELIGFTSRLDRPIEIFRTAADAHVVRQSTEAVTWTGITAAFNWRQTAAAGFYASLTPTLQDALSSGTDAVTDGLASSLPRFHGTAVLGYRNLLFEGDLAAKLILLGRFWTGFRGRTYDPVHSLMVLPETGARSVDGSGTLDVRLEAGIREATLFLSFDNVLARSVYPGVLVVPVYPLPARAFRFGVFWPIWG